jgi:hypothetical protein
MKTTTKKLSLNRETVRGLDDRALQAAAGGALGGPWSLFTGACRTCTTGCGSGDPARCGTQTY